MPPTPQPSGRNRSPPVKFELSKIAPDSTIILSFGQPPLKDPRLSRGLFRIKNLFSILFPIIIGLADTYANSHTKKPGPNGVPIGPFRVLSAAIQLPTATHNLP